MEDFQEQDLRIDISSDGKKLLDVIFTSNGVEFGVPYDTLMDIFEEANIKLQKKLAKKAKKKVDKKFKKEFNKLQKGSEEVMEKVKQDLDGALRGKTPKIIDLNNIKTLQDHFEEFNRKHKNPLETEKGFDFDIDAKSIFNNKQSIIPNNVPFNLKETNAELKKYGLPSLSPAEVKFAELIHELTTKEFSNVS